jgi:hypothetical protein
MFKRKHRSNTRYPGSGRDLELSDPSSSKPDPALFIQAHEADIIRGPSAEAAVLSLTPKDAPASISPSGTVEGSALIRWEPPGSDFGQEIWVDRYVYL